MPLESAPDLLSGRKAKFGAPVRLDLGGNGVRSIERVGSEYFIVADPPADDGRFKLYQWSGEANSAPSAVMHIDFHDLRPEALFAVPGTHRLQVLSDDGGILLNGVECKRLDTPSHQMVVVHHHGAAAVPAVVVPGVAGHLKLGVLRAPWIARNPRRRRRQRPA